MATFFSDMPGGLPDLTTYPYGGLRFILRSANGQPFPPGMKALSVQFNAKKRRVIEQPPTLTYAANDLELHISYRSALIVAMDTAAIEEFFIEYSVPLLVEDGPPVVVDDEPVLLQKVLFSVTPGVVDGELPVLFVNINGTQLVVTTPPPGYGNTVLTTKDYNLVNERSGYLFNHNQNTRFVEITGYFPDGVTIDPAVGIKAYKDPTTGVINRNVAELVYPRDNTTYTGHVLVKFYADMAP